jgi:hypothetical protein
MTSLYPALGMVQICNLAREEREALFDFLELCLGFRVDSAHAAQLSSLPLDIFFSLWGEFFDQGAAALPFHPTAAVWDRRSRRHIQKLTRPKIVFDPAAHTLHGFLAPGQVDASLSVMVFSHAEGLASLCLTRLQLGLVLFGNLQLGFSRVDLQPVNFNLFVHLGFHLS